MESDRIWIVTFPDVPTYDRSNRVRTYYQESTLLRALSKYGKEVDVKVYNLVGNQVGKGKEIYESYLKIKKRDRRLGVILDGDADELKRINNFMELLKKYSPKNRYMNDFKAAMLSLKSFKNCMKKHKTMVLYHISDSVEWYESVFRLCNFRLNKGMKEMLSDNMDNIKKAKENLKNER